MPHGRKKGGDRSKGSGAKTLQRHTTIQRGGGKGKQCAILLVCRTLKGTRRAQGIQEILHKEGREGHWHLNTVYQSLQKEKKRGVIGRAV